MDSDPLVSSNKPDDFAKLLVDGVSKIQYKQVIFLFIIFIILTSDVFINRVLSKISGAVEGKSASNYGTVLQGIFLVLGYILIDFGVNQGIV